MRDGEPAIGPRTFGVHTALWDHLPIEVGELFQVPDILQQLRAPWASGHAMLIVRNGASSIGGQLFVLAHCDSPLG